MKGSTAGARHLAESAIWMAWWGRSGAPEALGTLMESVVSHWALATFVEFLTWRGQLPCSPNGRS
jgi:hypothetical protein